MKIMIAVHTYYPEKNGVQQVTQYLAEGLARNHDVLVLTNWQEGMPKKETFQGVNIERLEAHRNILHVFCGDKKKYLDRIQSFNPDALICVCTQSWPFDWTATKLDKLDCITILYTHGYSECFKKYHTWKYLRHGQFGKAFNSILNWIYYGVAYKYIAKYDLVTYLSECEISYWYAKKHNLKNGKVLGNAIEDRFFEPILPEEKKSTQDGIVRFLYVANYAKIKGQEMVLRAFYDAKCDNAELIFCGSNKSEYYKYLIDIKKQLDCNGEKKVTFLYEQTREETWELYRSSDVFVCGSNWEAYSISLCEAMASELAVITTDVGNASTIPNLVLVHSQEEMTHKMEDLYHNDVKRRSLGQALKQYADANCKISDKVNWMEQEIERLCQERRNKVH